jgi:DNA-binding beta-propeller fold protein YncE
MESRIPPSSKINCEIHTDVQIDYFCSQHDVVCCRACLSDSHRSCESVLPLDSASKDVRNSSLLSDTLEEQDYMTETLSKMEENRDENRKLLKQKKSLIIKQISAAKSKVLKYLDDIEERLITEVASVQEKNEEKINREKLEICQLTSILKDNKQELEFLKDHGSNNQLFLTLRKQITNIQKTDKKIHDMSSAINEIDMEFEEIKNVNIETIGSLSQITRPCPIKYKSMKAQHQQVKLDRSQTLTEFIKEDEIKLKPGVQYWLTDMAVTSDNKLLLCNRASSHQKVYIYKDYKTYEDELSFTSSPWCITVVPCTDKAVVTLPYEGSIQFINTTNNTKGNKIKIGERCWSVTAGKDKIYIGGDNKVIILNTEGSFVRKITTNRDSIFNNNLLYNERNDQLLLRQDGGLCCINLDGHVIYRYDISGDRGLAVDQQGHVYTSGTDDIHRLSPDGTFRDIVLSKHDGVDWPWSITFNNDFTKLFIINRGGKTVLVYSCK